MSLVSLTFKLPDALQEEFNELCSEKSINKSELMRRLIQEWISENKGE